MIICTTHSDFFRRLKGISKTGKRDVIVNGFSFQSDGMRLSCFELFNSSCLVTTVYARTPEGQKELLCRPHYYQHMMQGRQRFNSLSLTWSFLFDAKENRGKKNRRSCLGREAGVFQIFRLRSRVVPLSLIVRRARRERNSLNGPKESGTSRNLSCSQMSVVCYLSVING